VFVPITSWHSIEWDGWIELVFGTEGSLDLFPSPLHLQHVKISRSTPTSQPKLLQASRKMGGSAAEGSITPDDNNKNMYNTAKYPMIHYLRM